MRSTVSIFFNDKAGNSLRLSQIPLFSVTHIFEPKENDAEDTLQKALTFLKEDNALGLTPEFESASFMFSENTPASSTPQQTTFTRAELAKRGMKFGQPN